MKKSPSRRTAAVGAAISVIAFSRLTRAEVPIAPPPPRDGNGSADRAPAESPPKPLRIGAIGGVGFPRPLAIEGMALVGDVFAFGAEYGVLPATTFDGVRASLWSLAADARVFPFHGAFFVGLRAGRQHVDASTMMTVGPYGSVPETLDFDSWFLNPRVGFLWTSQAGLALGVEAGIQFPLSSSVASTLPLSLAPSVQRTADTLGSSVVPTIDLFRIGMLL